MSSTRRPEVIKTTYRTDGIQGWAAPANWKVGTIADTDPESLGKSEPVLIAIVDDNPAVLKSIYRLLKSVGFKVQAFTSAEDFLQTGDHSATACLILDVRLPGMTGLELQRKLAATLSSTPIIFVSAHDDPEVRHQAIAAGAVTFLGKPFSADVLLKAVDSVIN